jgi:hypothetical protein
LTLKGAVVQTSLTSVEILGLLASYVTTERDGYEKPRIYLCSIFKKPVAIAIPLTGTSRG